MANTWKYVRRLKSGRLEFRRAFPERLKDYLNKHELIASLGARTLAERGAAERYGAALGAYEQLVAQAHKATTRSFDELSKSRIEWLVAAHEATYLADDDAARVAGTSDKDSHNAADDGYRDILEIGNMGQIRGTFQHEAVTLGARQGWVFDLDSREFGHLCLELLRTTIEANALRMDRDNGNPVPTPAIPPRPL